VKILVVDDDPKTLSYLFDGLVNEGYTVDRSQNGTEAFALVQAKVYDLLILDIVLPGMSGLDVLKSMRKQNILTPTIFLSAKHTLSERLLGLKTGSDDYVTKPFSLQELLLRIEAILRRTQGSSEQQIELGYQDLKMNLLTREVTRGGKIIKLQTREFLLLEYMMKNQEKIVTKSTILLNVLDYQFDPQTNVVDVLMHRLRGKVDRDFSTKLIQTIRGVGYVLKAE
jgi:two-component system OmpR family response regulator